MLRMARLGHGRLHRGLVPVALLGWLWAAPASATVMVEVPLEAMVQTADAVVVGRVLQSEARLVLDPRRGAEPHTFTELVVSEWIVGGGADRVLIEEIGGTIQGETYRISGTPEYAPGMEVVAFLERRPDGSLRTMAMTQGRFEIRRGVDGAPDSVRRDLEGIAFATWAQGGQMSVGHAHAEPAVELEVFLATLRQLSAPSFSAPTTGHSGAVR